MIRHEFESKELDTKGCRKVFLEKQTEGHILIHENHLRHYDMHNNKELYCDFDKHIFNGRVYSYAIQHHQKQWTVRGVYCSLSCMIKHLSLLRHVSTETINLTSLMIGMVYDQHNITPASDLELLTRMPIQEWRDLPRQHIQKRIISASLIPFRIEGQSTIRAAKTEAKHALEHTFMRDYWFQTVPDEFWTSTQTYICAHDGCSFTGIPYTLPHKFNFSTNTFTVEHVFCSPNCVKAFIFRSKLHSYSLLTQFGLMMIKVYGVYHVEASADPFMISHRLQTVAQYRAKHIHPKKLGCAFEMKPQKFQSYPMKTHPGYRQLVRINEILCQQGEDFILGKHPLET